MGVVRHAAFDTHGQHIIWHAVVIETRGYFCSPALSNRGSPQKTNPSNSQNRLVLPATRLLRLLSGRCRIGRAGRLGREQRGGLDVIELRPAFVEIRLSLFFY